MTINEAVGAIEQLLKTQTGVTSTQVRPSGDDLDVIKVWVAVVDAKVGVDVWKKELEAEIRKQVPGSAPFRLEIHAEVGV